MLLLLLLLSLVRSMTLNDTVFNWRYLLEILRLPHTHSKLLRSNAQLILHLSPYITRLSSSFRFSEIIWHNRLTNIEHSLWILLLYSLWIYQGLFEKWSTLDSKKFYAILFQKLVFLISLYPEFLEKKNKEIKKSWFWSILAVFVSPSMLI